MAAPTVTRVANFLQFEGDQAFTLIFPQFGVKKAKFSGIEWYLDPEYKYPCQILDPMEFPNFKGYPQIFYAKASGSGPLRGSILILETSPHINNSYVEDFKITTWVAAL